MGSTTTCLGVQISDYLYCLDVGSLNRYNGSHVLDLHLAALVLVGKIDGSVRARFDHTRNAQIQEHMKKGSSSMHFIPHLKLLIGQDTKAAQETIQRLGLRDKFRGVRFLDGPENEGLCVELAVRNPDGPGTISKQFSVAHLLQQFLMANLELLLRAMEGDRRFEEDEMDLDEEMLPEESYVRMPDGTPFRRALITQCYFVTPTESAGWSESRNLSLRIVLMRSLEALFGSQHVPVTRMGGEPLVAALGAYRFP